MAVRQFLASIDLGGGELLNARLQVLATAPTGPPVGLIYFDSTLLTARQWNGTDWAALDVRRVADGTIALSKLAVDVLARANHTGTQTASTISDFSAAVTAHRLDQLAAPTAAVSFNGQRVTNVATPTANTDAVNKAYADALSSGRDWKDSVRVASVANHATLGTTTTVDGVLLTTGDRVLLRAQTAAAENGIYTFNGTGLVRAADADENAEVSGGLTVPVEEGTYADSRFILTNVTGTVTLGTTALTFTQDAGETIQGGAGLTKTGNTLDVVAAATAGNPLLINADSIDLGTVPVARGGTGATTVEGARTALAATTKYVQTITGNGTTTAFTVPHGLGTPDVDVSLYTAAGRQVEAQVDVAQTSPFAATITTDVAIPNTVSYRVVVVG